MNRATRLRAIMDLLGGTTDLGVTDLAETLDVSVATVRRDLNALAAQQLLTRVRGGAARSSVAYDLPRRYGSDKKAAEKRQIAQAASLMVDDGAVVGLSGGTTSTAVAMAIGGRDEPGRSSPHGHVTVVTNAINIAAHLALRPHIKVVLTGGVAQSRSYELVGPFSDVVLQAMTLDIAFIGVNGLDPRVGPTVHDEAEARVNQLMAERASRAVLVADSSKFGIRAFATVGSDTTFHTLITDAGVTAEQLAAFEERGIEVVVAR